MLNQTNQMEPSFATAVEPAGELPEFLSAFNAEISAQADSMIDEIIFRLLDKWEDDMARLRAEDKLSMNDLLGHYVRLKISLHHLKRRYDRDFSWPSRACDMDSDRKVLSRINSLSYKTKEARREYYVAKRRYEGEHERECTCRGCRCIKGISP